MVVLITTHWVMKILRLLFLSLLFVSAAQSQSLDRLNYHLVDLPTIQMESAGVHPDTVSRLIELITTTPPNDFRGLVVIKDNKLVVEEYFNTYWRDTIHDIRSAGKSVTSILLGIAIDRGLVKSVDDDIYTYFPSYQPIDGRRIKIKHLLMMSSGLDADVFDNDSKGNGLNWIAKNDWVNHVLHLSMNYVPGERWVYNDASAMLVGAIIEEQSKMKLSEFANEYLFKPLGIREYYWYTGLGNRTGAMGNLYMSALDFAKLGMLILNDGQWQNQQIVSKGWISEMLKPRLDIEGIDPFAKTYGYFWYNGESHVNGKRYQYSYAAGNGGNLLFIVPEEQVVVSLISSAYGQGYGQNRSQNIFDYILSSF